MGQKVVFNKTNFNGGEITPKLYGRLDVKRFDASLKTATNFQLLTEGGAQYRNGTQYIAKVKDSTKNARLIPFKFATGDVFVLEMGENYTRFYQNKAQVTDGGSPVEITTPWTESQLQDLQYTQFAETLYLTHPSVQPRTLVRNSTTSWSVDTFYPLPAPTEELGFQPAGSVTPGATTGLAVTFTASDSVFLDGDVGRQIINLTTDETGRASITAVNSATEVVCDIVEDFTDTNAISNTDWKLDLSPIADLTPNGIAAGSIITLEADVPGTTTDQATFRSDDVGKYILIHDGVCEIIELVDSHTVDCEVLKSLTSEDETGIWTLEEETWSSSRGWPRAVGLHEQRLYFGGTTAEPQSLWGSEAGLYDGFGLGANDDDGIDVDIVSSETNQVEWIASARDLVVGTSGAEITVLGDQAGITPDSINQRARTYHGSQRQQVVTAGSEILFVPRNKKRLRTFVYNFDIDGYKAEDLLELADHFLEDTSIREVAYAQEPEVGIYVVLEDGNMLVGTFNRDQNIIGWSKYTTDGSFEQVVVVPETNEDQVWVVVKRTIDGADVRYIEVFDTSTGTGLTDGFSDSFLTYSGASTTTLTGLDHLEGETVEIKGDGATQASKTVSGGSITLDTAVTSAVVGLPYTGTIETLDADPNFGAGPLVGQPITWVDPRVLIYRGYSPTVNGQTRPMRNTNMEMDQPVDLYSGILEFDNVDSASLTITYSKPHPLTITGIFGTLEAGLE